MIEMARLDGVPPNMSVSSTTPSPASTSLDRAQDVLPALFHVVVGADADGGDVALRPDDMLERGDELRGEPAVGDENHANHAMSFTECSGAAADPRPPDGRGRGAAMPTGRPCSASQAASRSATIDRAMTAAGAAEAMVR